MTDTAIPLPEQTSNPKTADGALTPEQKQRAAALDVARATLISRTGLFGSSNIPSAFGVQELLTVAEWVLAVGDIRPGSSDWRAGYTEGVHAALVNSVPSKKADQIKASLGVADAGRHPSDAGGWCAPGGDVYDMAGVAQDANARLGAGEPPVGLEHVDTFMPSALDDIPPLTFDDTEYSENPPR